MGKSDYWNLTGRPHTKLKLDIYKQYLSAWCSIFMNQPWAKDIFIIDCFAGKGKYLDNEQHVDGSPLIAVKTVKKYQDKFKAKKDKNKDYFKVKCFFIDKDKACCKELEDLLTPYKSHVDFEIIPKDFNLAIEDIVDSLGSKPALFFIDPYGIKSVKKESVLIIVNKSGAKDILFNYINEGVVRVSGITKKCLKASIDDITAKEIKTIKCLTDFIGADCIKLIDKSDREILKYYVESILKSNNKNGDSKNNLDVVAFSMPYPHKSDTIYFLLFASRNKNAIKIVRQVYAASKKADLHGRQSSLFDTGDQLKIHDNFRI